jgi:hypothetical protein
VRNTIALLVGIAAAESDSQNTSTGFPADAARSEKRMAGTINEGSRSAASHPNGSTATSD